MLKKLLILITITLLFAFCIVGCRNKNTTQPEEAVKNFADSVGFDKETGTLSFTIPQGLPSDYCFYIHVSSRVRMGDGAMSIHLFEEESENNSWESGKTYSHGFGKDELLETLIVVGIQEQGKSEVLYETQIDIDENGGITLIANSPREGVDENPAMSERETSISEKSESNETVTDGISYPIKNADPSIGAFGNDLLHTYNNELVSIYVR